MSAAIEMTPTEHRIVQAAMETFDLLAEADLNSNDALAVLGMIMNGTMHAIPLDHRLEVATEWTRVFMLNVSRSVRDDADA
jgi:hypothetical protein